MAAAESYQPVSIPGAGWHFGKCGKFPAGIVVESLLPTCGGPNLARSQQIHAFHTKAFRSAVHGVRGTADVSWFRIRRLSQTVCRRLFGGRRRGREDGEGDHANGGGWPNCCVRSLLLPFPLNEYDPLSLCSGKQKPDSPNICISLQ